MIKIIIADDHKIFRESLIMLFNAMGNYKVIAEASNGNELLKLLEQYNPDVVILDISMPGMDGIEAIEIISKKHPGLNVLVLSMYDDEKYYLKMVECGVKGFILKDAGSDELEKALSAIVGGDHYFSQQLLRKIVVQSSKSEKPRLPALNKLSKREKEVLFYICKGYSNKEISEALQISPRTIEIHKTHLIEKTGAKNTINLILYSLSNKLFSINDL